jgi:copper chaperone
VLAVSGMTWGGWADQVRTALVKVDGVQSADVSMDTKEATVAYDPAKTTPEQLAQVVDEAPGMADFSATVKPAGGWREGASRSPW